MTQTNSKNYIYTTETYNIGIDNVGDSEIDALSKF